MKSFRHFNTHLYETSAPGQEKFIKDNKEDFKKRYGKDWERVLYATAWKRHDEELKEFVDILEDFVLSEEFEQLDELSKDTLKSYIKKAKSSSLKASNRYNKYDENLSRAPRNEKASRVEKWKKERTKSGDLLVKRLNGLELATKKLAESIMDELMLDQDFQQLDELSKETLKSYVKKAQGKYQVHLDRARNDNIMAGRVQHPQTQQDFLDSSDKHYRLANKRYKGMKTATKKLAEEQLDELSKKTLASYIKKATKDGEEKHENGLYSASKKEAQMSTGSALRSRVDRLQWKSPATAKSGEARTYDAARQELKQRGEHHFAGIVNRSGRLRDSQEPRRDPISGRMNEEQLSEGYRNVEHRKRDSMFWRDMHYHNANPIGDPEYSHETETHKISFHAPTNTWKLKNKKTNEIQNGSGGLRNLHRALTNLKEESTDFYHFTDDVIVTEESKAHIEFKRMGVEYRVTHDGSVVEVKDKLGWHRTYALNIVELARKILQQHFGGQQ